MTKNADPWYDPETGKFWRQASIRYEGTNKNLGYFATREKAATVYHEAALQYHGEFARLDL